MLPCKKLHYFFDTFSIEGWSNYSRIFIAVSGGRDSIFLLTQLIQYFDLQKLCVLHVNHGMRATSKRDENLVKDYCISLGVDLRVKNVSVFSEPNDKGVENTARKLRYAWFSEVCFREKGALFCGHTLDDQIETVLMNIYRGSGFAGLSGISWRANLFGISVYRPLLCLSRKTITSELKQANILYCDDESNSSDQFFRNKIRNQLIPSLSCNLTSKILSINVASKEILQKVTLPKIELFNHFIMIDLIELNSLSNMSLNKTLDEIYKIFYIEGSPLKGTRTDFFAFLKEEKRLKLELPAFIFCQKSREKVCFFLNKKTIPSVHFIPLQECLGKPCGIWVNVRLIKSSENLIINGFIYKLDEEVNLSEISVGFLSGLEKHERHKIKKKMENCKIPSFFYQHWPIVHVRGSYFLSKPNFRAAKVQAETALIFSGVI